MISQNTPNKLSRRNWLRDAAIVTTGAAVMPSLLTSCADHRVDPGNGGLGVTDEELLSAASNLNRMAAFLDNIRVYTLAYEQRVFDLIKGGTKPTGWKDIFLEVFTDIALGILEATVAEIPGAGPAIAAAYKQIDKWASNKGAGKVNAAIEEFRAGYDEMVYAASQNLLTLGYSIDNYAALKNAFKDGPIEFMDKKYTLLDLAQMHFPAELDPNDSGKFAQLRDAAYIAFQKHIWNAMFLYTGKMEVHNSNTFYERASTITPRHYAEGVHYPNYKATYLRGYFDRSAIIVSNTYFYFASFYFTFDGLELSDAAAKVLFKDDWPDHITNPDGLFNRDYVFKQFHTKKPDFLGYYEIRKDDKRGPCLGENQGCSYFDPDADNYDFTAGEFPQLIKK